EVVEAPLIEDSVACYECKKRGSFDAGDHTLFLGEIVATHVSEIHTQKIYTTEGWAKQGPEGFKTIAEINGNS
ncbi:flavin reductase, partial [Candidatus Bipolaricaulota bacterium]|nr:flavin reductase [Candidatus Bipolaricaulota bacterium]